MYVQGARIKFSRHIYIYIYMSCLLADGAVAHMLKRRPGLPQKQWSRSWVATNVQPRLQWGGWGCQGGWTDPQTNPVNLTLGCLVVTLFELLPRHVISVYVDRMAEVAVMHHGSSFRSVWLQRNSDQAVTVNAA